MIKYAKHGGRRYRYTMQVDALASDELGTCLDFTVEQLPLTMADRMRAAVERFRTRRIIGALLRAASK